MGADGQNLVDNRKYIHIISSNCDMPRRSCKKLLLSWKVSPNHAPIKHFVFTHIHIQMNVDINKFAVHSF